MRGYFGIGVEGVSKPMNVGALLRTAQAFGASFVFTIAPATEEVQFGSADTSAAARTMPLYRFDTVDTLVLPEDCSLVGVELLEDAIELPSFRHPRRCAYVLGPERSSLSPALVDRCDYVVKIPTRFAINLSVAGALVMYDRLLSLGRFAERPVATGGPTEALKPHVHGKPFVLRER
ncbi:MAG: TrmH family RNA methyltransferase [Alphaproteobacteria bacterium]|jgi:tRNA G18 (ribose-2'-O)-methylase SpoU|nr:TrmH family RNA methyltransferase [Alphaproteobacteria bacterium]